MSVICGDSLHVLPTLDAESVDAIVCDPPYGLSFMGKDWDHGVPGEAFWREAWRVAKPGAHLVAFGGTRTYHRLAVAIEDAGWEIRDCLSWLYGSGFPKSHDVSKAIDKVNGQTDRLVRFVDWMRTTGLKAGDINRAIGKADVGSHYLRRDQPAIPTPELWGKLRPLCGNVPAWVDELVERIEAEREVVGTKTSGIANKHEGPRRTIGASQSVSVNITAPATDLAREWQGWGTALKPAYEPIILARKPLIGTVAANVTQYGTGALNVDGCRIAHTGEADLAKSVAKNPGRTDAVTSGVYGANRPQQSVNTSGRWPANVCLDEEAAGMLDAQTGNKGGKLGIRGGGASGVWNSTNRATSKGNTIRGGGEAIGYGDSGGASRFFYTAKASQREREAGLEGMPRKDVSSYEGGPIVSADHPESSSGGTIKSLSNHHPTVKPIALMRWLCRLVTPKGGLILDPFTGSGTTGCAAVLEGFRFVGVEREPEYAAIAEARIAHWAAQTPDADLFTEAQ